MTPERKKEVFIDTMYFKVKSNIQYFSTCLKYDLTYIRIYNEYIMNGDYKTYWALALMD